MYPMAKLPLLAFMALCCTFASVWLVNANPEFHIVGRVYCDTCRAGFVTNVTEYIPGAKVRLEITPYGSKKAEYQAEAVTDNTGTYHILAAKDAHEKDICEVVLVESPRSDCNEIISGRNKARIVLSTDTGIQGFDRFPNELGFLKDKPLDICGSVMKKYDTDEEY